MNQLFDAVNRFFAFIVPISDFLWDFPTNYEWYAQIPILGNFALSILILVGAGIFFTTKTGFVQVKRFKRSIKIVANRQATETGISPFAAFMLSSAMRVGPGNIMGVTGAVSVGGPRCYLLDVCHGAVRNGYRFYRSRARSVVQGKKRKRNMSAALLSME